MHNLEPLLTVDEVTEYLRVSRAKVYEMIRNDVLKAVRPTERTTRIRREDVVALIEGTP